MVQSDSGDQHDLGLDQWAQPPPVIVWCASFAKMAADGSSIASVFQ